MLVLSLCDWRSSRCKLCSCRDVRRNIAQRCRALPSVRYRRNSGLQTDGCVWSLSSAAQSFFHLARGGVRLILSSLFYSYAQGKFSSSVLSADVPSVKLKTFLQPAWDSLATSLSINPACLSARSGESASSAGLCVVRMKEAFDVKTRKYRQFSKEKFKVIPLAFSSFGAI